MRLKLGRQLNYPAVQRMLFQAYIITIFDRVNQFLIELLLFKDYADIIFPVKTYSSHRIGLKLGKQLDHDITKTCLYIIDPCKPHVYIVKLGFTGVYIIFLSFARKHRLWVLVRTASPRRF